jgi:hypothetical protein
VDYTAVHAAHIKEENAKHVNPVEDSLRAKSGYVAKRKTMKPAQSATISKPARY